MRFFRNNLTGSQETPGCIRASGEITWANGEVFTLWVDVPSMYGESLSEMGNPWLLAMLPIAASLGEDIELSLPVDALLLESLKGVLAIWREWYPDLHDVQIRCPVKAYSVQDKALAGKRTVAFFSGGIDSYFSVVRRMPGNELGIPAVGKVDDLLTVWGFDVGVHDEVQFRPLGNILAQHASDLNLNHIIVRTNLRDIPIFKKQWGPLTHAVGLVFIALLLDVLYERVVIGSSDTYAYLTPWGSHPMLDILFSTSSLQVIHDGASYSRMEKTAFVSRIPFVGRALHVCQALGSTNCSQCEKCLRSMIAIDILDAKDAFLGAFDWSLYSLEKIRKLYINGKPTLFVYKEMIDSAKTKNKGEIVKALQRAYHHSKILAPMVHAAEWLESKPFMWRFGRALKTILLSGSIGPRYIHHLKKLSDSE